MISSLTGILYEKLTDKVIIDVNGVGYGVYVASEDYNRLVSGEKSRLYIYEHVREQAHDLYGFLGLDTQRLFEQLLDVSGIGPKMALNMLSIGSAQAVRQAIAKGDVTYLQSANGVGRRVAERVVVELKDKVGLLGVDLSSTGLLQSEDSLINDEAATALIALGYSATDAAQALKNVEQNLTTEERVKQALKGGTK